MSSTGWPEGLFAEEPKKGVLKAASSGKSLAMTRGRFTKNVKHRRQKFLNNELRSVVAVEDRKIIFDSALLDWVFNIPSVFLGFYPAPSNHLRKRITVTRDCFRSGCALSIGEKTHVPIHPSPNTIPVPNRIIKNFLIKATYGRTSAGFNISKPEDESPSISTSRFEPAKPDLGHAVPLLTAHPETATYQVNRTD